MNTTTPPAGNVDDHHAAQGRERYVTDSGRVVYRKHMYWSSETWDVMFKLSRDSNLPLGKLLEDLVFQERQRRRDVLHKRLHQIG